MARNPITMTPQRYKQIRKRLGYSNYAFRRIIGVSLRTAYRYENEEQEIPETIARLIIMYDRHGIPADLR